MSIPVQISLELLRYGDEGEPAFCLTLDLLNANGKSLTAAIDVDYKWKTQRSPTRWISWGLKITTDAR